METIDAIKVLETAGYQVRFDSTVGAYVVTLWDGCKETLTRKELVLLAKDVKHVS